jgi:hypothetical protein
VRERRRCWSVDDKLRLVAETHEPGVLIQAPGSPTCWRESQTTRR